MSDNPKEEQPKEKRPKPKRGRRKQFVPYKKRRQTKPGKAEDVQQPSTSAASQAGLFVEAQHAAHDEELPSSDHNEELQLSDHVTNEGSPEQIPHSPAKPDILAGGEGVIMEEDLEAESFASQLISAPSIDEESTPGQFPRPSPAEQEIFADDGGLSMQEDLEAGRFPSDFFSASTEHKDDRVVRVVITGGVSQDDEPVVAHVASFSDQVESIVTSPLHVETSGEPTLLESEFQMDVSSSGVDIIVGSDPGGPGSSESDGCPNILTGPQCPSSPEELLKHVEEILRQRLPNNWFPLLSTQGIQVGLRSSAELLVVKRSAFFAVDGRVVIGLHGRSIPPDHFIWENVDHPTLSSDSVEEFVQNIVTTVKFIRSLEVCRGIELHPHLWKTVDNAIIDSNPFFEQRYQETCRATTCLMLVKGLAVKRCSECNKIAKKLIERNRTRPAGLFSTPPKRKPNKYLNTPEKQKRLEHAAEEIKKIKRANAHLRKKLDRELQKECVRLKSSMSESILEILNSPEAKEKLTEVQKMFIEELVKSADAKDPRGVRWHPGMIALAISIQSASPGAYEELSGLLKLPSGRQLFNYSHAIEGKDGVNHDIIRDVAEDLYKKSPPPCKRYHVLSFDEMYIRKNLVFLKQTGELVGYVQMDHLSEELARLEKVLSDKADEVASTEKPKPPVANKILCYMIKGVANGVSSVVACYGVANVSKEALYFYTWEVIGACELSGLWVLALAADGASINQGFFQSCVPLEKTKSGVVFVTTNIFSGKPLYFINDPAHLLKTCRNNLFYSGMKNLKKQAKEKQTKEKEKGKRVKKKAVYYRLLTKNGQTMTWSSIREVYKLQRHNTLRTTYKLNKEDIELNSFSMMKVPLAAHVLSASVATEIRLNGMKDSEELAIFCETMNNFFDMINGLHSFQATRQRNENLATYKDVNDERFSKLMDVLMYFEEWHEEVKKMKPKPVEKVFITDQTFTGLERTIRGFIGAVKFVLTEGKDEEPPLYINGRVFSSDDLEKYYSKLRGMFGSNRHPDLHQAVQATAKMHARSALAFEGTRRSNVGKKEVSLSEIKVPKTKKARRSL